MVKGQPPTQADVVVLGGGPAGLAAAIAARQVGLSVVLVDHARFPIDKACGEGLMPDGVAALRSLGIELPPTRSAPFRGIRFVDGELEAEAAFAKGCGRGVERPELHRLLAERAQALGVIACWQSDAQVMASNLVAVDGRSVHCRWIVGADGLQSRLRRHLEIAPHWQGAKRIGLRRHFRVAPWTDLVEVHWSEKGQAYVTPVTADRICVAMIDDSASLRFAELDRYFPELARRLRDADPIDVPRGSLSTSATWRRVTQNSFALVGDASASVDAITGEGMALAFRQALALAPALVSGNLDHYEKAHRRLHRKPMIMARLLLLMGRHKRLRRLVLRLLAAQPRLFERLLALHIGGKNPVDRSLCLEAF